MEAARGSSPPALLLVGAAVDRRPCLRSVDGAADEHPGPAAPHGRGPHRRWTRCGPRRRGPAPRWRRWTSGRLGAVSNLGERRDPRRPAAGPDRARARPPPGGGPQDRRVRAPGPPDVDRASSTRSARRWTSTTDGDKPFHPEEARIRPAPAPRTDDRGEPTGRRRSRPTSVASAPSRSPPGHRPDDDTEHPDDQRGGRLTRRWAAHRTTPAMATEGGTERAPGSHDPHGAHRRAAHAARPVASSPSPSAR